MVTVVGCTWVHDAEGRYQWQTADLKVTDPAGHTVPTQIDYEGTSYMKGRWCVSGVGYKELWRAVEAAESGL